MITLPRVELLRVQIADAKTRKFTKVREAAQGTITRLEAHLVALLDNPDKFIFHTHYTERIPPTGYVDYMPDYFISYLTSQLEELGYRVERGSNGDGNPSMVIIRWDIERPTKKYGDVG